MSERFEHRQRELERQKQIILETICDNCCRVGQPEVCDFCPMENSLNTYTYKAKQVGGLEATIEIQEKVADMQAER